MVATIEERTSRLEGSYDHLATKADIARLEASMANLKIDMVKWMLGTVLTATLIGDVILPFITK